MKPILIAAVLSTTLAFSAFAGIAAFTEAIDLPFAGADEANMHDGQAGDPAHSQLGMERPAFPVGTGTTPSGPGGLEEFHHLVIRSEADIADAGLPGSGTMDDPYVIRGIHVPSDLYIGDTNNCFLITENYIAGQLSLNWNGQCVHVHHNFIRDLRVNENIERTGYATGGLIEMNKIEYIGQLRHYDGEFRDNIVGPRTDNSPWDTVLETVPFGFFTDPRVANVDGFNQGLIHDNTFYGSVDLDLHGHHHGTGFFAPHSHYHGSDMARAQEHEHDHTQRWTSVSFTDNKIIDPEGYGLRYDDQNHRGDDVTARSEDEMMLEQPHVHYTDIDISRNVIEGAPLWIDVFNAEDRNHQEFNPGTLTIVGNTISLVERDDDGTFGTPWFGQGYDSNSAIRVYAGREADMIIRENTLSFQGTSSSDPLTLPFFGYEDRGATAIDLFVIEDANIVIADNVAAGFEYGVAAAEMDAGTIWRVIGNDFGGAAHEVWWDEETVANQPATA